MKAYLSFNLASVDDRLEFAYANRGKDMAFVLHEFNQQLRDEIKYNEKKWTDNQVKALQFARDMLNEFMADNELQTTIEGNA